MASIPPQNPWSPTSILNSYSGRSWEEEIEGGKSGGGATVPSTLDHQRPLGLKHGNGPTVIIPKMLVSSPGPYGEPPEAKRAYGVPEATYGVPKPTHRAPEPTSNLLLRPPSTLPSTLDHQRPLGLKHGAERSTTTTMATIIPKIISSS